MDRALRDRWIAALRSGEYQQQRVGYLLYGGEWCCLGVLCDIHPEVKREGSGGFVYKQEKSTTTLPLLLAEELGLIDYQSTLISMNDVEGKTFLGIADWIEEHL